MANGRNWVGFRKELYGSDREKQRKEEALIDERARTSQEFNQIN